MAAGLETVNVLAPPLSPTGADVDLIVDVLSAVLPEHSSKVVT
jgi:hypothetical protein